MKLNQLKRTCKNILCMGLVGAVLLSPVCVYAQGDVLPSGLKPEEVKELCETYVSENETAGGAVRLSVDGELSYSADFGYADKETGIAITENTVFEWGTASHLLVWVSVLQMEEDGLLDMQTEVSEYLPEGVLKEKLKESGITLEHLMNYSSGYQDSLSEKLVPEGAGYASLEETLESSMPKHIYEPGSVVAVSDWPVALAAYIVENTSGVSYAEYVKENIFKPLGMEHTAMLPDLSDNEQVMNARKEVKSYQGEVAFTTNFYHVPLYPAGMVTGTIEDLHSFACELLVQDSTSKLFDQKETAEELFDTTLCYLDSEEGRIAHGMFIYRFGVPVYGVSGNSASQTAYVYLEPESKTCLTYMSNRYNEREFGKTLAEAVFGVCEIKKTDGLSGLRVYEGAYVMGNTTVKGKETFNAVLSTMFFTLGEGQNLVMPMFGNRPIFEFVDENHVVMLSDGSLGNVYDYPDGTTVIMMPMYDYVTYSSFTYWAQVVSFWAMLAGYFYSSLVVLIAVFGFIMRKFNKQKLEESKFRKYHYIQCLNVTIFSIVFVFMAMMIMAYTPAASIAATSMMYWLGSVMSLIYLIFFWKTGRKEEVSKKTKVLYWTTAVFAVITVIFAMLFGLIL